MSTKLFILLFLFPFMVFSNGKKTFEGIVTYKVTVKILDKSLPSHIQDYYLQKYGDTVKTYFLSNGSFYRDHYTSGTKGYDFIYYNQPKNEGYAKWKNIDTVYYYDSGENSLDFIEEDKGGKVKILGQKCKSYSIKGIEPINEQVVTQTHYYSGKPYIDASLYENYHDFFWDRIADKTKSIALKKVINLSSIVVIYEMVKIEEKPLPADFKKLPEGVPLKRIE